ncbi:MFS transporter [Methanolobus halotolerans]|uniref:MFS transporter n=1 Tax=Methanolobus halotolerans TaxID=2052935 RepID=A0A4E0Q5V4_9EURY|nr:MFS transporter [Methanolobus halotolerans]TGC09356.1 MFS transporter [Methanolobus halotolerans]
MDKNRFLLYSTVFLIMGLSNTVIPVLPEIVAGNYGKYGAFASSLLFSGYFIGALLTMLPFGFFSDRYDRLKFVVLAILLTLVSGLTLILTENLYLLVIARLVEGIACGAFFPVAYALLSEYEQRNRYIGEFNFLLNAGLATGVALTGYMAEWHIKAGIMLFTGLAGILFAGGLLFLAGSSQHEKVRMSNLIDRPDISRIAGNFTRYKYLRIWTIAFLLFGLTGVIIAFYPDYSKDLLSKTTLGLSIAALYVSAMASNILVGRMNIMYDHMIKAGIMVATIGTLVAIHNPIAGFTLIGIGSGTGMIGLPVAVSHMNIERGLAMGILNTYTYAGLGLMPLLTGAFLGILGFETIFIISAILLFLSLFLKNGLKSER